MTKPHPNPVITALVAVIHLRDTESSKWIAGIKPTMTVTET